MSLIGPTSLALGSTPMIVVWLMSKLPPPKPPPPPGPSPSGAPVRVSDVPDPLELSELSRCWIAPEKSTCLRDSVAVEAATPSVEATVVNTSESMTCVPIWTLSCVDWIWVVPSEPVDPACGPNSTLLPPDWASPLWAADPLDGWEVMVRSVPTP